MPGDERHARLRAQFTLLPDAAIEAAAKFPALGKSALSKVHRGQGDERHTVLFDPVDGSSPWLQSEEARRLLNVAFRRAKSRLVVFLSREDLRNPLLEAIAQRS